MNKNNVFTIYRSLYYHQTNKQTNKRTNEQRNKQINTYTRSEEAYVALTSLRLAEWALVSQWQWKKLLVWVFSGKGPARVFLRLREKIDRTRDKFRQIERKKWQKTSRRWEAECLAWNASTASLWSIKAWCLSIESHFYKLGSEWVSNTSERANRRASNPVLTSGFLIFLDFK